MYILIVQIDAFLFIDSGIDNFRVENFSLIDAQWSGRQIEILLKNNQYYTTREIVNILFRIVC